MCSSDLVFVVIESVMLLVAAGYALARHRQVAPILAVIVVGAGLASFEEPLVDVASRLWFAKDMHTIFGVFDRIYPVFFAPSYAVYFGLGACGAYLFMRGGSHRALRLYGGIGVLFDIVLEFFWIRADLYDYYGPQPFEILGFPLYWAFINTAYLFVVGYTFYVLQHWLRGPRLLLGLAVPVVGFGVLYGLAWPTWVAMNTAAPVWVMWVAAAFTMAASTGVVWAVCEAVRRFGSPLRILPRSDGPAASAERPVEQATPR